MSINAYDDTASTFLPITLAAEKTILGMQGNVGIGTASPGHALEIADAKATPSNKALLQLYRPNNLASPGTQSAALRITDHASNYPVAVFDHAGNPLFTIRGNRTVGIGTTSPEAALHINTDISPFKFRRSGGGGTGELTIDNVMTGSNADVMYVARPDGTGAGGHAFFVCNGSANNCALGINRDGLVGIGTRSPDQLLTINGNIRIGATGTGVARLYDFGGGEAMTFWQSSPSRTVDIWGHLWTDGYHTHSDIRLKTNVENLSSTLAKVMQLQGISYTWNQDEYKKMKMKNRTLVHDQIQSSTGSVVAQQPNETDNNMPDLTRKEIGLSAQELEKVFPELVTEDPRGYKGIDYSKLSVILLEAIKEQQKQIDVLKNEMKSIRGK